MKNSNLLNRLLSYSHEKQSPQRFARYAAILIMLLTLGVGQMWAWNPVYLIGDDAGNWTSGKTNYVISNNADEGSCYFYLTKNKYFAVYITYYNEQAGPGTDKSEMGINSGSQKFYIWGDGENNHSAKYTGNSGIVEVHAKQKDNGDDQPWIWLTRPTVYIRHKWNNSSWSNQAMTDNNDGTYKYKGQYSGTSSTNVGPCSSCTDGGAKFKYFTVTPVGSPSAGDYCLFEYDASGFKGFGTQSQNTGTLTITKLCGLTYDGNGRTGGTAVPSALSDQKYGSSVTLSSNAMTKTGYTLTGWNTANDGSGTHYDLGASFTFSDKSNTLYAEWTQTITVDKNTGTTAGSMSICFNAGSLASFTAATKDDWILDSYWTSSDESGSKVIDYDASTGTASLVSSLSGYITTGKWTRTAATTLYAHWKQTYRVTYNANYPASATSTSGSVPTDATEYDKNATVTVKSNSGSLAAGGYTFAGWQTEPTGGTTYTAGSGTFSISEPTTLYAKWTENKRNVTISAGTGGSVNKTSASVGVATTTTVTATAYPGYRFGSWSPTNCAVTSTSAESTTLKGNGTSGDGTLVANFNRSYAYIQGRFQVKDAARSTTTTTYASDGQWEASSTNIQMEYDNTNHRFELHTHMTPSELTANHGTGCQDCKPYFFIKTSTSNSSLAGVTTTYECTSSGATLVSTGSANGAAVSSSGSNYLRFNSTTTTSYAVVYFDESKIWYELEQRLQYDANGGSGTAPTGDNGHNSYHAKDANATAEANTFTARKNYTFAGWNTAADITGTSYAAGASVPMSADRILYAKWNRSVTLDQQDATTPGSTSVTATWNCSTLPTINNPEKTGYDFGGWYTETAGNGNIIINTSGQLQASKTNWTVDGGKFQRTPSSDASESKPLYAKWTQTVTLNVNTANHGLGDNTSATIVYKATAKTSITHCTPATGYHLEGYYTAATDGVKVLNADGSFASSAVTDYITDGKWTKAGATTLYAHYEPNTYDVILDVNGATSGSDQTVVATFDVDMPTTQKTSGDAITAPSKTGYTFGGYYANSNGTGTQYYTSGLASNHVWDVATNNTTIYAKWTANPYTVTLDIDEDNHGTIASKTTSQSVTYDGATTTVPALPTAAQGYALDGYYTDQLGEGTKVINGDGTWIASVLGYTDEDAKWIHDGNVTLYAYYKKAEITNLVAAPGVIAPGETITITPTIEPMPTGTTKVCWEVQYSNGTRVPSQPTFTPGAGNAVSFPVPSASATYIIQAKLAKGSDCPADPEDVLSTRTTTFQVAGEHTVTIRYQDSEGRTLQASASMEARPLTWTTAGDITPPTITGYTFARWDAGDGVTIKNGDSDPVTTTTTSSIQIKAVYDGTLTAVYNKKNMIFFNNTLGWEDVWVYFYNSDKYWSDGYGTGAYKGQYFDNCCRPYWEMERGHMTQIEGTNIWYFDYTAAGYSTRLNVAFTNMGDQSGVNPSGDDWSAPDNDQAYFSNTTANPIQVIRRRDHKSSLPMFVPLTGQTKVKKNNNKAEYMSDGYWMNYPENTGYVLHVYDGTTYGLSDQLQQIPFEFNASKTLPMSINVELNAGKTYGFEIHRADGTVLGENSYTLESGDSGDEGQTVRVLGTGERSKITTTVAGDYKFTLNFGNSGGYNYLIGVHYPVVTGDYRILYTDDATWSKDAHSANYAWWHESRTIHKENGATDIVSFYVKKDNDTQMKFQKVSGINAGTGAVTWADSTGGTISLSSISADGVYNFHLTQANGVISVSKIEPYTGNYYIRTDCAGATRWENFRTTDHQMTYSDYAETNSGYSHYYAHWVEKDNNIKFVIANDYSSCISDTLAADYGTTIADITTSGAEAGKLNSASANIRFMWDQATNKISRAYIGGSTYISERFLVLEGDEKMFDEDGSALNISGLNSNEANLIDVQNFVYERTIQVNTQARAKLTAKYNNNIQYFKGSEGVFSEGTTIELLGGDASGKHKMRIVYDFKTNRLVTAYVPEGDITEALAINADIMLVREHQEAGQQLVFKGDGALSKVKTVYGVMRFNRWTLNNKEKTGGHSVVGDPKSAYERGLYWISFPFNVNLSDVFGFGTYGTHWIIMEYDGAARATEGYWSDSEGFWKYVMPSQRSTYTLESGKGYVLALDLDLMKDNNTDFWNNNIEQIELFFPSAEEVENIESTNVTTTVASHLCTIDRTNNNDPDINKNRTRADSHWNIIGIPSYANYGSALEDGSGNTITWNTEPYTNDLPFLYEWSAVDNSYAVQSGTTYPFKAMHAYMVQYHGNLYWSLASATPPSIVARSTYAEKPESVEMRIELQQNEMKVDQTFVKLSNDENASANFAFDEDLCKEFNANKANIYTIVENYLPVAGNTMPMSEQTTVIPVGVRIAADGEYTFSIPDGTEGIGVTLIDNETGIRTNLGLMDYTVTLAQGQIDDRFLLEISPISQISTDIEAVSGDRLEVSGARKIMIDGLLYIVKDGVVYDAQGRRL